MPETSTGGADVRFHSTHWTVVCQAKDGSREALDELLGGYWKPVYFFVRRRGHDVESAKDLTQSFIAKLMERKFLERVSPELGRFRSFLLTRHCPVPRRRADRAGAIKRGGGLDFVRAESELASTDPSPERAFHRAWAREVVQRALKRLGADLPPEDLALLSGAAPAELTVQQRKGRARRLRERLRDCLRQELLPTVHTLEQADSEIRDLLSALG
jgi:RNA polymerase sigma-70 factor (ECF subfamily)